MIRKLAAALAASLLAAGAALAQPAGEQPATAPEVVYRIVQGGIEIGEAGLVLERDAAGITTSSRAELHGLVDVTAALRTGPDGAAESYGLEGTMRGVSVDLDATFHAGGVSFTIVQAGRESTLEVPSDEPLYVLDNLLASPPPPPPPDVPSLATEDATDGAPLTLREAMIRHRANPV